MIIIIKWLISAVSIVLAAYLVPGIEVVSFWSALWVAVFLGLFNAALRPILILLTLPINILTLGLFIFVINAFLVFLVSTIVKGFVVESFWAAVLFSVIVSIFSYFLNKLLASNKGL